MDYLLGGVNLKQNPSVLHSKSVNFMDGVNLKKQLNYNKSSDNTQWYILL